MFARITFFPTLVYNIFMEKLTNRRWYDRIDEHVILGAIPFKNTAEKLIKDENIAGVVSMNENYELALSAFDKKLTKNYGIKFLQLKTRDIFESPDQLNLIKGIQFIDNVIKETNGSIYVHCKAGRTRSATLVGCYLISKNKSTPEEAVNFMKSKRPHIWLRKKQLEALEIFYQKNIKLL